MEAREEKQLTKILNEYLNRAWDKYEKGVEKHGGKLWLKEDLIDQAIDENIDQMFYLLTLRQQLKGIKLGKLKDNDQENPKI